MGHEPLCERHPRAGDFVSIEVGGGIRLHLRYTEAFSSTRVDVYVRYPLRPVHNTRIALISRLLERGTRRHSDLRQLNRFLDGLYGADFSVGSEVFGRYQAIHLYFDMVSTRLLPGDEDLLRVGLRFLGDVLCHPMQVAGGFPDDLMHQEKAALGHRLAAALNDKMAYAQRRCLEEMCRGEPCTLSPHGDRRDLGSIDAQQLLDFHLAGLSHQAIDIFVSGAEERQHVLDLCREFLLWPNCGQRESEATAPADQGIPSGIRVVAEGHEVRQGKVVLGYRTRTPMDGARYPSLLLFNAILGEDQHSRLYREVRERRGLCYHIASYLEPMCGLMFVEIGVATHDHRETRQRVQEQILSLAEAGPSSEELEQARTGLTNRVRALDDDRGGLAEFALYREMARVPPSRPTLEEGLRSVGREDVAEAARKIHLDTVYFVYPN